MRGGVCWDTNTSVLMATTSSTASTTCVQQGNLPRHFAGYQTMVTAMMGTATTTVTPSLGNVSSMIRIPPPVQPPPPPPRPLLQQQQQMMLQPTLMQQQQGGGWEMQSQRLMVPKQEPLDEDKTDSGIHSGSDFHSSSPGSDSCSQEYPIINQPSTAVVATVPSTPCSSTTTTTHPNLPALYNTGLYANTPLSTQMKNYGFSLPYHVGFNPLTPPSNEPMLSPKHGVETDRLTPNSSPGHQGEDKPASPLASDDPLKQLQMTFEKTDDYLPESLASPKMSEHSNDDDNIMEEFDEQGLRIPKINSHGKVKMFKCKQCDFVAITKLDFWEHSKGHIKTDKLLTCPKCPFVTEYKHHLEYHLRNHFGSKPFKCDKCSYSCVNKSMLNSHMKSHSNIYQYRCSDCSYATKYCHSLKLHLRKYCHKPAMVLNPDGTPNPLPIIDVYGTRRGPKMKSQNGEEIPQVMHNPLAQMMMTTPPQMQLPFPYSFLGAFPNSLGSNPLFFPQLGQQLQQMMRSTPTEEMDEMEREPSPFAKPLEKSPPEALDLSKPDFNDQQMKNRRKGKAFKLDRSSLTDSWSEDDDRLPAEPEVVLNEEHESLDSVDVAPIARNDKSKAVGKTEANNNVDDYTCQFCNIAFGDAVLYTMHMGYHGYKDPFACNMCGEKCDDKVAFFLHIARNPHT